jgi:hypothetical protein
VLKLDVADVIARTGANAARVFGLTAHRSLLTPRVGL